MLFLEPREGRVSTAGHQRRSWRSANVPSALAANRSKKAKTSRSLDFIEDESMDKRVDQAVGDKLLRRPTGGGRSVREAKVFQLLRMKVLR